MLLSETAVPSFAQQISGTPVDDKD
jgi:hypothetical protein